RDREQTVSGNVERGLVGVERLELRTPFPLEHRLERPPARAPAECVHVRVSGSRREEEQCRVRCERMQHRLEVADAFIDQRRGADIERWPLCIRGEEALLEGVAPLT